MVGSERIIVPDRERMSMQIRFATRASVYSWIDRRYRANWPMRMARAKISWSLWFRSRQRPDQMPDAVLPCSLIQTKVLIFL